MNQYGIENDIWKQISATCSRFPNVKRVILYGSRARGDYKSTSDIDLAIDAPHMTSREYSVVWNALDDLPIIYTLDIVHLQSLKNEPLLQAIINDGMTLQKRSHCNFHNSNKKG